jgi:hypothetical protein
MGFFDRFRKQETSGRYPTDMKDSQGLRIVFEGPFPLATPEGRLNCKNCGTTFDWATVWYAQATYVGLANPDSFCSVVCRKCSTRTAILREDIQNVPKLPGMTSKPLVERTIGSGTRTAKYVYESPLPLFNVSNELLCRRCGRPQTEAAYDHWREHVSSFLDMLTTKGMVLIKCSCCEMLNAYAAGEDPRLKEHIKKLVESLPD